MNFTSKKFRFLIATAMSFMLFSCEVSSGSGSPDVPDTPDTPDDGIYQFHSTVTYLDAGTDGTAGTNGTYCLFGDWPQTIKEQDVEVDESQSITMGGAAYYLGSDKNYYAKCTEQAYNSSYTYSNGTAVNNGNTQYFKVEPIKWRVLNPDATSENKILLAEKVLTANISYYGTESIRTLNETTIYSNNYMYSNIRAYLNGKANQFVTDGGTKSIYDVDWTGKGFFQTAFTATAQGIIADTKVDNSAESTTDKYNNIPKATDCACSDTDDKIFLLSVKEVTASGYGFADYNVFINDGNGTTESARVRQPSDFAIANREYLDIPSAYGIWWLRSPSALDISYVRNVWSNGLSGYDRTLDLSVFCSNVGIVPALSISAK